MKNWQKVSATLKINNLIAQYCSFLFFKLTFIDCVLSEIVSFDQLWTAFQQKLVTANRKLVFFKMPQHFWSVYCPKLSLNFTVYPNYHIWMDPLVSSWQHAQLPSTSKGMLVILMTFAQTFFKFVINGGFKSGTLIWHLSLT